jgi:hypothetical protein
MDCYGLKLIPAGNLRELIDEEIRYIRRRFKLRSLAQSPLSPQQKTPNTLVVARDLRYARMKRTILVTGL